MIVRLSFSGLGYVGLGLGRAARRLARAREQVVEFLSNLLAALRSPAMSRYFERLGLAVERAWNDAHRDDEMFPEIAATAFSELPPSAHFDREAFIRAELEPFGPARRERAPLGAFGQPGVTTYFGREFVIEVYFWVDSIAGIHDHPFRGIFAILEGESVHARYAFEERERVGARVRIGELRPQGVELLRAGEHRLFSQARHPLIHTLIHVPVPSISMVIRTIRSAEYWRYLPPSLALLYDEQDQVIARQLALLEGLRQSNDPSYREHLERYLASADLETSLLAVFPFWAVLDEPTRSRLLGLMRDRHGARADAVQAALAQAVRVQQANALRQQLRENDDRFVATALMCCTTRGELLTLLETKHADPIERLHRFVHELGEHAAGDEASAKAAHLLIDGGGRSAIEQHIREHFGEEIAREQQAQIARFCTESIFAGLID